MILKPIPDFPDYFAGDDGEIYSTKPLGRYNPDSIKKIPPPRLLKKSLRRGERSAYYVVSIHRNKIQKTMSVARLVLYAFVGTPPEGCECCHGSDGMLCDRPSNLSWGTKKKNNFDDKYRDGTIPIGEKNHNHKLTNKDVKKIREMRAGGSRYCHLARMYSVDESTIKSICDRETWKHI